MKVLRCIIAALLVFPGICMLSGCLIFRDIDRFYHDTGRSFAYEYEGHDYEWNRPLNFWSVTTSFVMIDTAKWKGLGDWEIPVRVYDDPEKRFLYDIEMEILIHRTDDPLPDFKDIQQIERMELHFPGNVALLVEESEMSELVRLLSQPWDEAIFRRSNSSAKRDIATIRIYYKDYPACQRVATIIQHEGGLYGLVINEFAYPYYGVSPSASDFIPIPQNSRFTPYLQSLLYQQ